MSKVLVEGSSLTGIGSAIREKLNVSTTYKPSQMSAAIRSIQSGITPTGTKSITENGTYDVSNYASANVNISGSSAVLVSKTITQNGTYDPADDNADGYSEVIVNVSGSFVIYNNDRTLAAYLDQINNRIVWYFIGFEKTASDVPVPSEMILTQSGLMYSKAYDSDKETQIGQIGFYNGNIRSWSISTAQTIAGKFWGVVYSDSGTDQVNPYTDPPQ